MKILIIDGNSMLNRAYFALPEWRNRSGEATAGVYGFLSMLLKTIEDIKPTHLAVVFDSREGVNFRKQLYVGYHANRGRDEQIEEDIWSQVEKLVDIFEKIGVGVFRVGGVEADDTIGTLCRKFQETNSKIQIVVVTGDRDLMQLVNDNVSLLMPSKGLSDTALVDANAVKSRLGVWPNQVVDYKALVGDSSDNYPGVSGIGPKGAVDLLEKFGGFDEIYRQFAIFNFQFSNNLQISKLQFQKLIDGRAGGELSKVLATIKTDVEINFELDDLLIPDTPKWVEVFEKLGHRSLVARSNRYKRPIQVDDNQGELF